MNFLYVVPLKADTQIMKDSFIGEKSVKLDRKIIYFGASERLFESLKETPLCSSWSQIVQWNNYSIILQSIRTLQPIASGGKHLDDVLTFFAVW